MTTLPPQDEDKMNCLDEDMEQRIVVAVNDCLHSGNMRARTVITDLRDSLQSSDAEIARLNQIVKDQLEEILAHVRQIDQLRGVKGEPVALDCSERLMRITVKDVADAAQLLGGGIHGPNVETLSLPLHAVPAFIAALLPVSPNAEAVADEDEAADDKFEELLSLALVAQQVFGFTGSEADQKQAYDKAMALRDLWHAVKSPKVEECARCHDTRKDFEGFDCRECLPTNSVQNGNSSRLVDAAPMPRLTDGIRVDVTGSGDVLTLMRNLDIAAEQSGLERMGGGCGPGEQMYSLFRLRPTGE